MARGDPGINLLDEVYREHDISSLFCKDDENRRMADKELASKALNICMLEKLKSKLGIGNRKREMFIKDIKLKQFKKKPLLSIAKIGVFCYFC